MAKVYGYDEGTGDFREFASPDEWRGQITPHGIRRYLREYVRESLVRDGPVAVRAFREATEASSTGVGFFALARMLFPYVETLGLFLTGGQGGTSRSAVAFLQEYMGERARRYGYKFIGPAIYAMYRHGLTHTAMPKTLERDDGKLVTWNLTFATEWHLKIEGFSDMKMINFSPPAFMDDVLAGLDLYAGDFDTRASELQPRFESGFLEMATVVKPRELRGMNAEVDEAVNRQM